MKSVLRSCLSHCLCTRIAQKYMVPGMNLMTKARSVSSLTPLTMRHHKSTWVHPVFNTICYSTMTIPVTSCENHLQLLQFIHSGDSSFLFLQRARSFFMHSSNHQICATAISHIQTNKKPHHWKHFERCVQQQCSLLWREHIQCLAINSLLCVPLWLKGDCDELNLHWGDEHCHTLHPFATEGACARTMLTMQLCS